MKILPKLKQKDQREKLALKRGVSGLGLFAKAPIKKGTFIIEYIGPLLTNTEVEKKGGQYLFALNDRWTIDGSTRANLARYINHFCVGQNCEPIQYGLRIKIFAKKDIQVGEELTYNYGKEFYNEYIKGSCRCPKHRAQL